MNLINFVAVVSFFIRWLQRAIITRPTRPMRQRVHHWRQHCFQSATCLTHHQYHQRDDHYLFMRHGYPINLLNKLMTYSNNNTNYNIHPFLWELLLLLRQGHRPHHHHHRTIIIITLPQQHRIDHHYQWDHQRLQQVQLLYLAFQTSPSLWYVIIVVHHVSYGRGESL
jgi:hypothetical protein